MYYAYDLLQTFLVSVSQGGRGAKAVEHPVHFFIKLKLEMISSEQHTPVYNATKRPRVEVKIISKLNT